MGGLAKVTSIDVIERFSAALKCFGEDVETALEGIDMEVRRALNWIRREQKDYWTLQIRRGWDEVNIARKELERKTMVFAGDDRPSCHDERLALEAAKRRLRLAQEKVEAVARWSHRIEREVNEYLGAVQVLRRWTEFDLPQAQADLARMARALEDYVALEPSVEPTFPDELSALIGSQSKTAAAPPEETTPPRQPAEPVAAEPPADRQPPGPDAARQQVAVSGLQADPARPEQEKADG